MDYPIVKVRWLDACGDSSWLDKDELVEKEPAPAITVGFLIIETDTKVILASGKTGDGSLGSWDCIPKGMIQEMVYMVEETRKID